MHDRNPGPGSSQPPDDAVGPLLVMLEMPAIDTIAIASALLWSR